MKAFKSKLVIFIFLLIITNLLFSFVLTNEIAGPVTTIKGITVVAPPKEIGAPAFKKLTSIHTEWVSFVPYGFIKKGTSDIRHNLEWQWWGEKKEGVECCVMEAKDQGLKVMLKPQIYIGGGWIGDLNFENEKDWQNWEKQYRKYIFEYVDIAVKHQVEMLCIGTEINHSVEKRPQYWKTLISDIRKKYSGKLTYSANWDHYQKVSFWKDLDFVGISSYFPLTDDKNPLLNDLQQEWKPISKTLKSFSGKTGKKILFTEYGYMSVDGCAGKVWEIEKNKDQLQINNKAQATAYDALWSSLSNETYWAGGFLWKWFPDGMGHEGYPEKDYTPQGKPAELIIKKWFSHNRKI